MAIFEHAIAGLQRPQLVHTRMLLGSHWVDADDGQTLRVRNPADGSVLGCVPKAGRAETRRAIDAAYDALPAWRAQPASVRSRILRRWYELTLRHAHDLARI